MKLLTLATQFFNNDVDNSADDNAEFYAMWDSVRDEALTPQEREEIDAIFARHAA